MPGAETQGKQDRLPVLSSFFKLLSVHKSEVVGAGRLLLKWAWCVKDTGVEWVSGMAPVCDHGEITLLDGYQFLHL